MYKYFVSYFFNTSGSWGFGVGNAEITRKNKITTYEEIREISNELETQEEIKQVSIINYILLEESEG